jgi:hypothetical protein
MELPQQVLEELRTQFLRVEPLASAQRVWDRLLTPAERQRLGGNVVDAYARHRTLGMWMTVRRVSQHRAIAELAHGLGFLSDANLDWLLREIGEPRRPGPVSVSEPLPCWHRDTGVLTYGRHRIRKVRVMAEPSNIQCILDAFERSGWPRRIENPLPGIFDQQRLHLALASLNRGLARVRFSSQEGGHAICWTLR